jgi:hypothetical protein
MFFGLFVANTQTIFCMENQKMEEIEIIHQEIEKAKNGDLPEEVSKFKQENQSFIEEFTLKLNREFPREVSLIKNKDSWKDLWDFLLVILAFMEYERLNCEQEWQRWEQQRQQRNMEPKRTSISDPPDLNEVPNLPDEILIHAIFPWLSLRDLYNLSQTNKNFNSLIVTFITEYKHPLHIKTSSNPFFVDSLRHKIGILVLCDPYDIETFMKKKTSGYAPYGHKKIATLLQSHPITLDYTFHNSTDASKLLEMLSKQIKDPKLVTIKLTFDGFLCIKDDLNILNICKKFPPLEKLYEYGCIEELTI